jgi:hypothetical protein
LGQQDSDVELDPIAELFACVRLIQVAFLVSSFAEEHVPEGCETERLESGSLLKFFNVRTGNSSFARARAMANVEALESLILSPLGAEHQLRNDDVATTPLGPSNGRLIKRFGDSQSFSSSRQVNFGSFRGGSHSSLASTPSEDDQHPYAGFAAEVVQSSRWQKLMLFAIFVSCAIMFFKDRDTVLFLIFCDSLCSLTFLAEAALKISSGPYFHDSWNRLDFLIVLCAVLSPVFRASGIGAGVDACTIVRAFRPLRFINYVPKIKVQVNMLFKSFSSLGTLAVFMGFSMTAYAIVGLQLLKGLYYFCDDGKWEENALYLATVGSFPTNSPRDGLVSDNGLYTARPCSGNYTTRRDFHSRRRANG